MIMDAEVCVIGGGIVGLWTAYLLARQGVRTILFEQFQYPHIRGSSHGQSRIIRYQYAEEEYASMMPECFKMWKQLERDSGRELLLNTGLAYAYDTSKSDDVTAFHQAMRMMEKYAPAVESIPGELVEQRFPGLRFSSQYQLIYDEFAALLKADVCLGVLQKLAAEYGCQINDGETVKSFTHVNDSKVKIETVKNTYLCRAVVVACGPFTNQLLAPSGIRLPLRVMKPTVFYWQTKSDKYSVSSKFPSSGLRNSFYSIPVHEYPGLIKLCYDAVILVDPNATAHINEENRDVEKKRMAEFKLQIEEHFPDVDTNGPAIIEECLYTRTPDEGFIIDRHPKYNNVIIGAGFSGHGFKTSPVVGRMLANMSMGQQSPYPLQPFSMNRFCSNSKL